MSRLQPIVKLSEFLPNARRPAVPDVQNRYNYFRSAISTSHSALAVNDDEPGAVTETARIRSVQVGAVTGGTVTVQVYVNGSPVFQTAQRPVSGGRVVEPHAVDRWNFPAGSFIETVIEATSGAPSGEANVNIETEPFVLAPKVPDMELHGKSRLFPSRRQAARLLNDQGAFRVNRESGKIAVGTESGVVAFGRTASPGSVRARDYVVDPIRPKPGPIGKPRGFFT